MSWKEFFKPAKSKIILFIILFILGEILIFPVLISKPILCERIDCNGPSYHAMWRGCSTCGEPSLYVEIRNIATYIFLIL
jgi:hypothetical protein